METFAVIQVRVDEGWPRTVAVEWEGDTLGRHPDRQAVT